MAIQYNVICNLLAMSLFGICYCFLNRKKWLAIKLSSFNININSPQIARFIYEIIPVIK